MWGQTRRVGQAPAQAHHFSRQIVVGLRWRLSHPTWGLAVIADKRPVLGITIGDCAGIGPELIWRAWSAPELHRVCRPVVYGDLPVLRRQREFFPDATTRVEEVAPGTKFHATQTSPETMLVVQATTANLASAPMGKVSAVAGQGAYDCLVSAIDAAVAKQIDGILTMPLNKEGLHAAGLKYPGHTEILAERTGVKAYAMMLYRRGLGVAHVTLHQALRDVAATLSIEKIVDKIRLCDDILSKLSDRKPRLAVCAFNPHAGDGGLFGDEEARLIVPAVEQGKREGYDVTGPLPADTLFVRANKGEFDGVVAMYHDQGHIALKLLGWKEAVNITCGLPITRVSVAHGTAYDIVGRGLADPASFYEAAQVGACLARQ